MIMQIDTLSQLLAKGWRICFVFALLVAMLLLVASCQQKKSAEQLYTERASGVVLIKAKYYFVAKFEGGGTFYFNQIHKDDDGEYNIDNLALSYDDLEVEPSFGTGFIVSHEGEIITNRHVVSGDHPLDIVGRTFERYIERLISHVQGRIDGMRDEEQELLAQLRAVFVGDSRAEGVIARYRELDVKRKKLISLLRELRAQRNKACRVELVTDIGVAYNDDILGKAYEFKPCVLRHVADGEDLDLALIQLKKKKTPQGKYVFSLEDYTNYEDLELGQRLYMIGYNAGLVVANTADGIKAQVTSGEVSQKPTSERILYSIPLMAGSSGSPVIDEYGRLVAVNFASFRGSDNFNVGEPWSEALGYLKLALAKKGIVSIVSTSQGALGREGSAVKVVEKEDILFDEGDYDIDEGVGSQIANEQVYVEVDHAKQLLFDYYEGLKAEYPARAAEVFYPYGVRRYYALLNTNRQVIIENITSYLNKYEIVYVEVPEFSREGSSSFSYAMNLKLRRRRDQALLLFRVRGDMACIYEGGRVYIVYVHDKETKLLRRE